MIYKFPASRSARPKLEKPPKPANPEDEQIGDIQGQVPDSKEEWWVAEALNKLGIPYQYQYSVFGGRAAGRGGYLIDFIVYTQPLATMIEIYGGYWHDGEFGADDKKRQADIESAMEDVARVPMSIIWASDLIDSETVFRKVREAIYG